jgi:hypothetical protein
MNQTFQNSAQVISIGILFMNASASSDRISVVRSSGAGAMSSVLHAAFTFAILACLVAAGASLLRGGRYRHGELALRIPQPEEQHAR